MWRDDVVQALAQLAEERVVGKGVALTDGGGERAQTTSLRPPRLRGGKGMAHHSAS